MARLHGLASGRTLGMALLVALLGLRVADPLPVELLRLAVFDLYQAWAPRPVPADPMARPALVVDLDEESLAAIGQWPWPRTILADLVAGLARLGAAAIGFDVVFAEEDRLSPVRLAESLAGLDPAVRSALARMPGNDERLAEAIRGAPVVLGQSGLAQVPAGARRDPPRAASIAVKGPDPRPFLLGFPAMVRNVAVLEAAAAGLGVFTIRPERDGIVRRVPALITVAGDPQPTLAIETLRVALGDRTLLIETDPDGGGVIGVTMRALVQGGYGRIPTDSNGLVWVRFSGHEPGRFVSAKDVLAGTVPPERVRGKIVLVGTSAAGLLDLKATPVADAMPGVEVHAQLIENVVGRDFLSRPTLALEYELAATLAAGALMIAFLPLFGARWALGLFVAVAGALAGTSWYLFTERNLLIDVTYPLAATVLLYMLLTYSNYAREEAARRRIRTAFSRYLAPSLVERLAADPSRLALGGEMRTMTLLFADVRGFTTISEQFDAQGLTRLVNRYLTPMTNAVLDRQGTIDKYMGDAIMAFWNAPMDDPGHARHACRAALAMRDLLGPFNRQLEAEAAAEGRRHIPIRAGFGLNTGECCVGNMGSDQRFDYSVLGDTVNLASRLEGQTKEYHVDIIIGETTREMVPDLANLELDLIRVQGKTVPVRIHALLGGPELFEQPSFRALAESHAALLAAYRDQRWEEARAHLAAARARGAGFGLDGLYALYAARIAEFEASPPGPGWDGVYVATSK